MSRKALDVFFRHKFLILLPLVALTLAGVMASRSEQSAEYVSTAKVWTQAPTFLDTRLSSVAGLTPARAQANVLKDLLSLDSFRSAVSLRLDGLVGPGVIGRDTTVSASSSRVLTIRHTNEDPALAQAVVQAVIDTYSETVSVQALEQADFAEAFYDERLEEARERLNESSAALASLQDPASGGASSAEGEALINEALAAENEYYAILDRLEYIHVQRDTALRGRDLSFQVMDPPTLPSSPLPRSMKEMIMLPFLGFLVGLSASGIVFFALARVDQTIRLPEEAARIGVPVLASIPDFGRRRRKSWPRDFVQVAVAMTRGLMGLH